MDTFLMMESFSFILLAEFQDYSLQK